MSYCVSLLHLSLPDWRFLRSLHIEGWDCPACGQPPGGPR